MEKIFLEFNNLIKNNKTLLVFLVILSAYFIYQAGIRFGEFIYFLTKK